MASDLDRQIAKLSPAKQALLARKRSLSVAPPPLVPTDHSGGAPLSYAQQRIWLIQQLDPDSHLYNVPRAVRLKGRLNPSALEAAFNEIVRRHEALRTVFQAEAGEPKQIVLPSLRIEVPLYQAPNDRGRSPLEVALELAGQEYRRPFDLRAGPLLRVRLWRLAEDDHLLLLVMHHIVSDGWSGGVLFHELGTLYQAFCQRAVSPLAELPIHYPDFALWQRAWMERVLEKETSFWRERLAGAPPALDLPIDHPRPESASFRGHTASLLLTPELTEQVISFSQQQSVTLFTAIMAALQVLLHRWTGQADLVLGTVTANRNTAELEKLIGCFMNFLAVRQRVSNSEALSTVLGRTRQTVLEAFAHQDCPFEKVVEAVNPERAADANPLYNVALLLQNYPAFSLPGSGIEARFLPFDPQVSFLDLRFIVTETPAGMLLECECNADIFDRSTADLLLEGYRDVLAQMVEQPTQTVASLRLPQALLEQARRHASPAGESISIAATFTAEPLRPVLEFWMKRLQLPSRVQFAPYNQVFQQLLDPSSMFLSNTRGTNVVLCRIEDLVTREALSAANAGQQLSQAAVELSKALRAAVESSQVPFVICIGPPSNSVANEVEIAAASEAAQQTLAAELNQLPCFVSHCRQMPERNRTPRSD